MNQNITSIKKISWHLLFWILFFGAWYFLRYDSFSTRALAVKLTLLKVADLALMVYISNYILVPYLLYRKKYFLFGLIFVVLVFSFSVLKMYLEGLIMHNPGMFSLKTRFKARMYDNTIPHFLLVSTGVAFKLLLDHAKAQKRIGEIAKEKAEAELNFLKSQINPHFLFNSLNSVYFLIDKQNKDARQTLLQFADLLRYQLYDCNAVSVEIEKEVMYLQDYMRLQQLRKDKQYEVQMKVGEEVKGFRITPLLLIPFVENAFKHISHHHESRNFIFVEMSRLNGTFNFLIQNSKDTAQRSTEPVGGIGLANVKRRLELLYPGKHALEIEETESLFKVVLN